MADLNFYSILLGQCDDLSNMAFEGQLRDTI